MRKPRQRIGLEPLEVRAMLSAAFSNGQDNDLVKDTTGAEHLAYFDNVSHSLKYVYRPAGGAWGAPVVIDSNYDAGKFVSINVDRNNLPGMAYYDSTKGDLKYAKYNGSTWGVETVEDTFTTGYYPSLVYNNNSKPIISYYYKTGGDLKIAVFDGAKWTISPIDSAGDVGRYTSIALQPSTGYWGISYENTAAGTFKYARQTSSGSVTMVVDSTTLNGGGYTSLAFEPSTNIPTFTYYDANSSDLKFARATGVSPAVTSDWTTSAIAGGRNQSGMYSNLWYQSDNKGRVVYYNETENALYMLNQTSVGVWDTGNPVKVMSGGGREAEAVRLSNVDFTYTWVYTNPDLSTTLYVNDTNTGENWTLASNYNYVERSQHGAAVFTDPADGLSKMWVAGGYNGGGYRSDVWSSANGVQWTQITSSAAFGRRDEGTLVSFSGKLWMIGGRDSYGAMTSGVVYSSTDGVTWTDASANLPAVYGHSAVVFTDPADGVAKLWVIGGRDSSGALSDDVYKSADGVNWTAATSSAAFGGRSDSAVVIFNGKMWLVGGNDSVGAQNDVWSSSNGATWTLVRDGAEFGGFSDGSAVAYDNNIWVFNGNLVWYSMDGYYWNSIVGSAPYSARQAQASLVFDAGAGLKMWVLGGRQSNPTAYLSDAWYAG